MEIPPWVDDLRKSPKLLVLTSHYISDRLLENPCPPPRSYLANIHPPDTPLHHNQRHGKGSVKQHPHTAGGGMAFPPS